VFAKSELSRTKTDSANSATIATILVEADMDDAIAREQGEDGVMTLQGALILMPRNERSGSFSASDAAVAPNAVPRFA